MISRFAYLLLYIHVFSLLRTAHSNRETFHALLLCVTICGQKSKLQIERNQEVEKIVKKYDLLLLKEEHAYHRSYKLAEDMYKKVFLQQSLAENFREKFAKSIPSQGTH